MLTEFPEIAQRCAPGVHHATLAAIANVESGFNPFAIGVVGGRLARQPRNKAEAIATAHFLERQGFNFSLGIAQINKHNLTRLGLTVATVFDICSNLGGASKVLQECYTRAGATRDRKDALHASLSCYYSGNFTRGFLREAGGTSYVGRVLGAARTDTAPPGNFPQ